MGTVQGFTILFQRDDVGSAQMELPRSTCRRAQHPPGDPGKRAYLEKSRTGVAEVTGK